MGLDFPILRVTPFDGPLILDGLAVQGCKIEVNGDRYIVGHVPCTVCGGHGTMRTTSETCSHCTLGMRPVTVQIDKAR